MAATIAMIRGGRIAVRSGIAALSRHAVSFVEGRTEPFDAVILATGFRPNFRTLLPDTCNVLNAKGRPLVSGGRTAAPGLFFCGAIASATGQLREIGLEARRIADAVAEDRQPHA